MISLNKFKTVLSFFAHPDDETLAAGATISKLCSLNIDVHVAIPATGVHARSNVLDKDLRDLDLKALRENCQEALEILGISKSRIYIGDFPDNQLDLHSRLKLIQWLENLTKKIKPDLILTHHRYCTNIDHQYCHEAAVIATRPSINQHCSIFCGEVPSSTGYLRPVQWEPNLYVEITEQDLENKVFAMETYKGEARPNPHPRSREVLKALAKVRGSESGFFFAEAFMIQKIFG